MTVEERTFRGERRVPLNQGALSTLGAWAALFPDHKPEDLVFTSLPRGRSLPTHNPLSNRPALLAAPLKIAAKRAHLECRFYDLRCSVAERLVKAGVLPLVLFELLGWSKRCLPGKRFCRISYSALEHAVKLLDKPDGRAPEHVN